MIRQIDNNQSNGDGRKPEVAGAFHALSDPARLAIFEAIRDHCCDEGCSEGEANRTVSQIAAEFGVSRPTASHHLKELRQAGLIQIERRGQKVYCSIRPIALSALVDFLTGARTAVTPVSAIENRAGRSEEALLEVAHQRRPEMLGPYRTDEGRRSNST